MSKTSLKVYLSDLVHSVPGNYVVPLNIAYLTAYSRSIFGNELDISLFKSPDELLDAIKRESPDILGFSNYSWNYDINRQIGSYIKSSHPSTTVVMGGPGIRTDDAGVKTFLQKNYYVDIYAMFEGEQPFANFIRAVLNSEGSRSWRECEEEIAGCAYLSRDQRLIRSTSNPIPDLADIPSVYLGGYLDSFLEQGLIPLFETNRGCPFSCTFCTWGISSLKKVRKFPIKRVYDEMDYVARIGHNSPLWIIADANFGIFERDALIAEKIREIGDTNHALQRVSLWSIRNRNATNSKIFDSLGHLSGYPIAVQSFDPIVQKNIKRANIGDDEIPDIVAKAKATGVWTAVDIILGLPGETKQSHLNTLRKCFDFGFDFIDALNIRMLPGSEIETDEQRQKYAINTKYRLMQGSYGVYHGIRSLEIEESARATSTMTESDMLYFRLLHWLIWFGWNTRFLAPLLRYIISRKDNPIDLLTEIINRDKKRFPLVDNLFSHFKKDAEDEWFDTSDELREYYLEECRFDNILKGGFSKLNFKYMAEMILNRPCYLSFIDFVQDTVANHLTVPYSVPSGIFEVMRESIIDADEVNRVTRIRDRELIVDSDILPFIVPGGQHMSEYKGQPAKVLLSRNGDHIKALQNMYSRFDFAANKHLAAEKILEHFTDGFTYDVSTIGVSVENR